MFDVWYVSIDDAQLADQFTTIQVHELIRQNAGKNILVWKSGMDQWAMPAQVPEFAQRPITLVPEAPAPPPRPQHVGVFRHDNVLVMFKTASLPDRCVKCNQPSNVKIKKTLYWHNPAWYALILCGALLYVIVALAIRKTVTLDIPLCAMHHSRRKTGILVSWLIVVLGIGLIAFGAYKNSGAPAGIGVLLFFAALIYGLIAAKLLVPEKIDDQYAWLKGVNPELLAQMPEFPMQPA